MIILGKFRFDSKKKKAKINFLVCKEDVNESAPVNGAHIEMFSNKQLIVDGCMGVIDYATDYLKIKLKKGSMIICGNSLYISVFENQTITVKGTVSSLEFCIGDK